MNEVGVIVNGLARLIAPRVEPRMAAVEGGAPGLVFQASWEEEKAP